MITNPAIIKEKTNPGPAYSFAAVPVMTKIPVPTTAPNPNNTKSIVFKFFSYLSDFHSSIYSSFKIV